jgi:hypothetical protein
VFTPERHPDLGHFETSMCGMNDVTHARLWHLGATLRCPLSAIAALEIGVADIAGVGLRCDPAPMHEFAEHAVIVGWDEESKDKRMQACIDLVAVAKGVLRPPEA